MNKDDLIKFDDGKCDFYRNGFDCNDCIFAAKCEHSEATDSSVDADDEDSGVEMYPEVEQLLEVLQKNHEDARPLSELPRLPAGEYYTKQARQNDCGCYVAVSDEEFTSLVRFFVRATKIDGKYYWYSANFC